MPGRPQRRGLVPWLFVLVLSLSAWIIFTSLQQLRGIPVEEQVEEHPASIIMIPDNSDLPERRFFGMINDTTTVRVSLPLAITEEEDHPLDFYRHHLEQMNVLINKSTALDWDPLGRRSNRVTFGYFIQSLPHLSRYHNYSSLVGYNMSQTQSFFLSTNDICTVAKSVVHPPGDSGVPVKVVRPHVLVLTLNENWGSFSHPIPNKTGQWNDRHFTWKQSGCTLQDDILPYLNHPSTKAVVTTQFQLIRHEKLYSLPLGVHSWRAILRPMLHELNHPSIITEEHNVDDRPQLLMINCRPRKMRQDMLDRVMYNFNNATNTTTNQHSMVQNTYDILNIASNQLYRQELRRSKFILSPGGIGLDTYRNYEALYMGTIPVLEHLNRSSSDGWYRTLDQLPVAWIDSYDNLTPEWLHQEYARITSSNAIRKYRYDKLTKQYWTRLFVSLLNE